MSTLYIVNSSMNIFPVSKINSRWKVNNAGLPIVKLLIPHFTSCCEYDCDCRCDCDCDCCCDCDYRCN